MPIESFGPLVTPGEHPAQNARDARWVIISSLYKQLECENTQSIKKYHSDFGRLLGNIWAHTLFAIRMIHAESYI